VQKDNPAIFGKWFLGRLTQVEPEMDVVMLDVHDCETLRSQFAEAIEAIGIANSTTAPLDVSVWLRLETGITTSRIETQRRPLPLPLRICGTTWKHR